MFLFTDRTGRFSALKTACFVALIAPALWLGWRALNHQLGPLAVTEAIHVTGDWAVRFLIGTLALTPAQRIFNWPRLALIRRMLGVGAFTWAAGHLSLYIYSQKFDLVRVASEILQRYYLTIGFVALLGLALLAATSTDGMLRRLGTWWKPLHRIVYGIAVLALLHFFMQSKIDVSEPTLMAGCFLALMIFRYAITRRWTFTPALLAALAAVSALATALTEFAWYALATGANPWRVLLANVRPDYGLRPAVLVLLAGLALTAIVFAYRRFRAGSANRGNLATRQQRRLDVSAGRQG